MRALWHIYKSALMPLCKRAHSIFSNIRETKSECWVNIWLSLGLSKSSFAEWHQSALTYMWNESWILSECWIESGPSLSRRSGWIHWNDIHMNRYAKTRIHLCFTISKNACICHIQASRPSLPPISRLLTLYVSFAEYSLFYMALLQKRPIILKSLLIVHWNLGDQWLKW